MTGIYLIQFLLLQEKQRLSKNNFGQPLSIYSIKLIMEEYFILLCAYMAEINAIHKFIFSFVGTLCPNHR